MNGFRPRPEKEVRVDQTVSRELTRHWFPDQQIPPPANGQTGFAAPEFQLGGEGSRDGREEPEVRGLLGILHHRGAGGSSPDQNWPPRQSV